MVAKNVDNEAPAGFDTRVGRERGDGWLVKSVEAPFNVVHGRLLGYYTMKQRNDDGEFRTYFQIRLSDWKDNAGKDHEVKVKAAMNDPQDKTKKIELELAAGQVLNVDAHTALEDMAQFGNDGGIYDVWFKYISKDPIPGSKKKTFWNLKGPILKTLKPGTRKPVPVVVEQEEEIPF